VGIETGYVFKEEDPAWRIFGNVTPRGRFPHLGIDMVLILGTSAWPEDASDFDTLFPEPNVGTLLKRLSRYLQDLF
jgi:hypothetical protein